MATPTTPLPHRISRRKIQSAPPTTRTTAICYSFLKQVFLHDWWLIRADSDSRGFRLGIGGFTSKENQGIRSFITAPIVKRHDAVTLKTVDGVTIAVHGHLNRSRTLENGFSHEVCDHFVIGFPYYWEEFATLSVDEEPTHFSDAYNTMSRNIFDDILSGASREKKKESSRLKSDEKKTRGGTNVEYVQNSGPLTRSRTRIGKN